MLRLDNMNKLEKTLNIINPISPAKRNGVFEVSRTSIEKYKSNLYTLLFTGVDERVMFPEFGTRITQLLFEPFDQSVLISIENEIKEKVKEWIPEINILKIEFPTINDDIENNRLNIRITFSLFRDESIQDKIEVEFRT